MRTSVDSTDSWTEGRILNIDKPAGMTSFAVVRKIRGITGVRKVGHAGTLDPFATGVLLVCTGRATKRVAELVEAEKEYVGTLELGVVTDTGDPNGRIVERRPVPVLSREAVTTTAAAFEGEILQVPPMYSALKQHGVRLYTLARKGQTVPRLPRAVRVFEFAVTDLTGPIVSFRTRCSKGTYIRSLAGDLGTALGCGASLRSLTRTRVGPYLLADALSLDDVQRMAWQLKGQPDASDS